MVCDGSSESLLAAYFAARRARHTGGKVSLMAVTQAPGFEHWLGVGDEIRREAQSRAESLLNAAAAEVYAETGERPELVICEGDLREQIMSVIAEDEAVRLLVVGAAATGDPGPLVSALARGVRGLFGKRVIPVAVVPGAMTREDIRAIS